MTPVLLFDIEEEISRLVIVLVHLLLLGLVDPGSHLLPIRKPRRVDSVNDRSRLQPSTQIVNSLGHQIGFGRK